MQLTKNDPTHLTTLSFYPIKRARLGKMIISQDETLQVLEVFSQATKALINKETRLTTPQDQQDLTEQLIENGFTVTDPMTRPAQYV